MIEEVRNIKTLLPADIFIKKSITKIELSGFFVYKRNPDGFAYNVIIIIPSNSNFEKIKYFQGLDTDVKS